jgi:hypothetical protein
MAGIAMNMAFAPAAAPVMSEAEFAGLYALIHTMDQTSLGPEGANTRARLDGLLNSTLPLPRPGNVLPALVPTESRESSADNAAVGEVEPFDAADVEDAEATAAQVADEGRQMLASSRARAKAGGAGWRSSGGAHKHKRGMPDLPPAGAAMGAKRQSSSTAEELFASQGAAGAGPGWGQDRPLYDSLGGGGEEPLVRALRSLGLSDHPPAATAMPRTAASAAGSDEVSEAEFVAAFLASVGVAAAGGASALPAEPSALQGGASAPTSPPSSLSPAAGLLATAGAAHGRPELMALLGHGDGALMSAGSSPGGGPGGMEVGLGAGAGAAGADSSAGAALGSGLDSGGMDLGGFPFLPHHPAPQPVSAAGSSSSSAGDPLYSLSASDGVAALAAATATGAATRRLLSASGLGGYGEPPSPAFPSVSTQALAQLPLEDACCRTLIRDFAPLLWPDEAVHAGVPASGYSDIFHRLTRLAEGRATPESREHYRHFGHVLPCGLWTTPGAWVGEFLVVGPGPLDLACSWCVGCAARGGFWRKCFQAACCVTRWGFREPAVCCLLLTNFLALLRSVARVSRYCYSRRRPHCCPACSPRHRHKAVVTWLRCGPAQLRDTSMLAAGSQLLTQFAGALPRGCGAGGESRVSWLGQLREVLPGASTSARPTVWACRGGALTAAIAVGVAAAVSLHRLPHACPPSHRLSFPPLASCHCSRSPQRHGRSRVHGSNDHSGAGRRSSGCASGAGASVPWQRRQG